MSETVQIPKGWGTARFGDIIELKHGHQFRTNDYVKSNGYKILKIGQLKEGNKLNLLNCDIVSKDRLDEFKDYVVKKNDILMALTGATLGRTVRVSEDIGVVFQNYRVGNFILKNDKITPEFLFYLLHSKYLMNQVFGQINRAAQPNIGKEDFENTMIFFPENKETQKKIVQKLDDILGQLEEKKKEIFSIIEQNKGRIDFFEKNWRAYIITNLIEKHCQENKTVKVMFEDVTKNITYGFTNPMPHTKEGHWLLTAKDIKNGFIDYSNALKTDDNSFENLLTEKSRPEIGLVLITKDGTLGRTAILDKKGVCINQSIASLEPIKLKISSEFLAYVLESSSIQSKIKDDNKRSTIGHIQITKLAKWEFDLPELPTQKQIIQNIKSAEEKFQSQKVQFENIKQNYENTVNHINHIQSSILDAAFSGKLIQ